MRRINLFMAGAAAVMTMGVAACGTAAAGSAPAGSDPVGSRTDSTAGMCMQGQPDCVDTPQLDNAQPLPIDETGIEQLRRDAQFYLGTRQDELNEFIRVGRINEEHMALTDDYQIGRITVELDDRDGDGTAVVTSATVELPDGPETFQLDD